MNPTFNLPDFTDGKSPIGVGTNYALGTNTDGAAPNITASLVKGGQGEVVHATVVASGAFYTEPTANSTSSYGGSGGNANLFFDASRSSSVYGANNTTKVVTSGTAVYICIRY